MPIDTDTYIHIYTGTHAHTHTYTHIHTRTRTPVLELLEKLLDGLHNNATQTLESRAVVARAVWGNYKLLYRNHEKG